VINIAHSYCAAHKADVTQFTGGRLHNRPSFRVKLFLHKKAMKEAPVEQASGSQHDLHTKIMWSSRKKHLVAAQEQLWLSYTGTVLLDLSTLERGGL